MVPVPVGVRLAPEPIVRVPVVFVPDAKAAHEEQGLPESTTLPLPSHFAQSLEVTVPVELAVFVPLPVKVSGV